MINEDVYSEDKRYFVRYGCKPHDCGNKGFLWVDFKKKVAIGVITHIYWEKPDFIDDQIFIFSNFFDNKEDSHLLKFYQGEIYRLKKEEKNNEKAIELYKESIEENDNFPDVYRELGLLLLKEEKKDEARKNLEKYVTLAPNAKDVEIVKSYIK